METIAEEIGSIAEELTGEEQALHDCFEKLPSAKRELLSAMIWAGKASAKWPPNWGRSTMRCKRPCFVPA